MHVTIRGEEAVGVTLLTCKLKGKRLVLMCATFVMTYLQLTSRQNLLCVYPESSCFLWTSSRCGGFALIHYCCKHLYGLRTCSELWSFIFLRRIFCGCCNRNQKMAAFSLVFDQTNGCSYGGRCQELRPKVHHTILQGVSGWCPMRI
jgi:hypothetical protein